MKMTLDVWERLMLNIVVGEVSGTVATMRTALKVLDVIEMTAEEDAEVGLQRSAAGELKWKPNATVTYDLEIKDKEAVYLLKKAFEQYEGWNVQSDARRVAALEVKLGLAEREDTDDEPSE